MENENTNVEAVGKKWEVRSILVESDKVKFILFELLIDNIVVIRTTLKGAADIGLAIANCIQIAKKTEDELAIHNDRKKK